MITEDYVSFETAKLLKEKGFDEECSCFYNNIDYGTPGLEVDGQLYYKNSALDDEEYAAPTLQMTMKWLRDNNGIAVIPTLSSILDNEKFLWDVKIVVAKTAKSYSQGWIYESYERACERAIEYCLKNLI